MNANPAYNSKPKKGRRPPIKKPLNLSKEVTWSAARRRTRGGRYTKGEQTHKREIGSPQSRGRRGIDGTRLD